MGRSARWRRLLRLAASMAVWAASARCWARLRTRFDARGVPRSAVEVRGRVVLDTFRVPARAEDLRTMRSRDDRLGCAAIECTAGRVIVLVRSAIRGWGQNRAQTSAIKAAVAALRGMLCFGGAEAPEQLLPYLERRHAISNQAGSVYRSVNADQSVRCHKACQMSPTGQKSDLLEKAGFTKISARHGEIRRDSQANGVSRAGGCLCN